MSDHLRADADKTAKLAQEPLASVRIGPLSVRAEASEVDAFRDEALGPNCGSAVPFTFPIRWFTHPAIRAMGIELLGPEPFIPFHESQSFDYAQPLEIDTDYEMTVAMTREAEPARLVLRAEIGRPGDGGIALRSEMVLRILRADAEHRG